jgi:hypothetical protein
MAKRRTATLTDAARALRSVAGTLVILDALKQGKRPIGFQGPLADVEGTTLAQDRDQWDGYAKRRKGRRRGAK